MKKNNKLLIILSIILVLVIGVFIYLFTMPKYEEGIDKLKKSNNLRYKFTVNLSNKDDNAYSFVESEVDFKNKISSGLFKSKYNEFEMDRRFAVKANDNKYFLYNEDLDGIVKTKEIDNEYAISLIDTLANIKNLNRSFKNQKFSTSTYMTVISKTDLASLFDIYYDYFGIANDQLNQDKYQLIAKVNRKGFLISLSIKSMDGVKLDNENNFLNLNILFSDFDNIKVEDITVNEESNVKPMLRRHNVSGSAPLLNSLEIIEPKNDLVYLGNKIIFKAVYSENVYTRLGRPIKRITSPDLIISFGNGKNKKADFLSSKDNEIYYQYIISNDDIGKLNLVSFDGPVYSENKVPSIQNNIKFNRNIVVNNSDDNSDNHNPSQPENPNLPVIPDLPIIPDLPTQPENPIKPEKPIEPENPGNNPNLSESELKDLLKQSKNLISGIDKALPEVIKQLKEKNISFSNLTLKDFIAFAKKIKEVYGVEKYSGIQTHTKSNEFSRLTVYSNGDNSKGPIIITPAVLHNNGKDENVYVVSLGGTEFIDGQATDIATDIITGLEFNNDYLTATYDAIIDAIPLNSKIVLNGISLGGMVAQQVASQPNIKNNYEILNIVTYGSPIIMPQLREGITHRLCDKSDIVPVLSISNNPENIDYYDRKEKHVEDGHYKSFISAHTFSYIESSVWDNYDVLGVKNGNASITIDYNNLKFYDALKK